MVARLDFFLGPRVDTHKKKVLGFWGKKYTFFRASFDYTCVTLMERELRAFYEDHVQMDFAQLYRRLKLTNVREAHMRTWLGTARRYAWKTSGDKAQYACRI